jgi:glutathione-regulated potassium-efflux system ancillary protein KefG
MLRRINDFEDVTVRDLHADYLDFMIEVEHEQQLLLQNNVIILQHPFY